MESKITFTYWAIQGLGQVSRYLLEYTGLPYEEKPIEFADAGKWQSEKHNMGFDFPNLPHIIDGDFKLSESKALMRYIPLRAKQGRLLGGNELDQVIVEEILGVLGDVMKPALQAAFVPKEQQDEKKKEGFEKIKDKLGYLDAFLGKNEWFLGYLTIADFQAAHILNVLNRFESSWLNDYKNLKGLLERFFEIPQIKKFVESGRSYKAILPPMAQWTGA